MHYLTEFSPPAEKTTISIFCTEFKKHAQGQPANEWQSRALSLYLLAGRVLSGTTLSCIYMCAV